MVYQVLVGERKRKEGRKDIFVRSKGLAGGEIKRCLMKMKPLD